MTLHPDPDPLEAWEYEEWRRACPDITDAEAEALQALGVDQWSDHNSWDILVVYRTVRGAAGTAAVGLRAGTEAPS